MKPVRRNMYVQLGRHYYGKWYPLRKFPRDFLERWANPKNSRPTKIRKPRIVDMIVNNDGRKMKRVYRGMLQSTRGNTFVIMSIGNRKSLGVHRVRV
jgi:hypothetical protein